MGGSYKQSRASHARTHLVLLKMTTFRQSEYEELTQQIREEEQKRRGGNKSGNSDLKTSKTMANPKNMLTDKELQCVTAVFRSFETGLRGATINPCDLHHAMKMLGLNPTEQEVVDIPNNIARKGLIYSPDFCQLVLERFREDDTQEENFRQNMFKLLCGTEPYPTDFKAKKYKLDKHSLSKDDFRHIMKNLPVQVADEDIEEMFEFADKDKDGELSYSEFLLMVDPPALPEVPKPHVSDLGLKPQLFSPGGQEQESNFASPILGKSSQFSSSMGSMTSQSP